MRGELSQYPDVSFIDGLSFEKLLNEMVENYEKKYQELTGKEITLAAADPKRLELYACAVLIYQGLQWIDRGGKNGLLKYSTGNYLDNLAALKKVSRNPAKAASTTMKFVLSKPQAFSVRIPKGIRVKANDLYFSTIQEVEIMAGTESAEVLAQCLEAGEKGNGFAPGEITTLVDPINYVGSVTNLTETSGGAEEETDDDLAERVYLAPAKYSTAGPESAYEYWIRTYNQAIGDCYIISESPGEVDIYVIFEGGMIPDQGQLDSLKDYLEEGDKKPLTDKVVVKAPSVREYKIDLTYYISGMDQGNEEQIRAQVEAACEEYKQWQQAAIGRDISPSRLIYLLVQAGAYYVDVRSPSWQEITTVTVSKATDISIVYGGIKDA